MSVKELDYEKAALNVGEDEMLYIENEICRGLGVSSSYFGVCPQCSSEIDRNRIKVCPVCGWQEYPF